MNKDFRVACSFPRHPKTQKLIRRLGLGAVTSLTFLWSHVAENRPSGDLAGMTAEDIALAGQWPEDPDKFLATLIEVGLIDQNPLRVHDWATHNGYASAAVMRSEAARDKAIAGWEKRSKKPKDAKPEVQQCQANGSAMPSQGTGYAPSPSPSPSPSPNPPPDPEPNREGVRGNRGSGGLEQMALPPIPAATIPEKAPEEKTRGETPLDPFSFFSQTFRESPEFQRAWADWLEYERTDPKMKKNRSPSSIARKKQAAMLETLGLSQAIAAINHTIASNWIGIREPDQKTPSGKGRGTLAVTRNLATAQALMEEEDESKHGGGF